MTEIWLGTWEDIYFLSHVEFLLQNSLWGNLQNIKTYATSGRQEKTFMAFHCLAKPLSNCNRETGQSQGRCYNLKKKEEKEKRERDRSLEHSIPQT